MKKRGGMVAAALLLCELPNVCVAFPDTFDGERRICCERPASMAFRLTKNLLEDWNRIVKDLELDRCVEYVQLDYHAKREAEKTAKSRLVHSGSGSSGRSKSGSRTDSRGRDAADKRSQTSPSLFWSSRSPDYARGDYKYFSAIDYAPPIDEVPDTAHCVTLAVQFRVESPFERMYDINFLTGSDVTRISESETVKVRLSFGAQTKSRSDINFQEMGKRDYVLHRRDYDEDYSSADQVDETFNGDSHCGRGVSNCASSPPPHFRNFGGSGMKVVPEPPANKEVDNWAFGPHAVEDNLFRRLLMYLLVTSLRGDKEAYSRRMTELIQQKFEDEEGATLLMCGKGIEANDLGTASAVTGPLPGSGKEIRSRFFFGTLGSSGSEILGDGNCFVYRVDARRTWWSRQRGFTVYYLGMEGGYQKGVVRRRTVGIPFPAQPFDQLLSLTTHAVGYMKGAEGAVIELCSKRKLPSERGYPIRTIDDYRSAIKSFKPSKVRFFFRPDPAEEKKKAGKHCITLAVYDLTRDDYANQSLYEHDQPNGFSVIISRKEGESDPLFAVPFWNLHGSDIIHFLHVFASRCAKPFPATEPLAVVFGYLRECINNL